MRFGSLVGNTKGVKHPFVRCGDCVHCMKKPVPCMCVYGRPEGSIPVGYMCALKSVTVDHPEEKRVCSSFKAVQLEPREVVREYCVTFSGRGRAVIKARSEDEAWDLAENGMVDMDDFTELEIENVELNT